MKQKNKQENNRIQPLFLLFSLSVSQEGKHTRERTSENLLLHLCCDVFSPLTLPLSPSVCVCARLSVCEGRGRAQGEAVHRHTHAHTYRQQCVKTEGRSDSHTRTCLLSFTHSPFLALRLSFLSLAPVFASETRFLVFLLSFFLFSKQVNFPPAPALPQLTPPLNPIFFLFGSVVPSL